MNGKKKMRGSEGNATYISDFSSFYRVLDVNEHLVRLEEPWDILWVTYMLNVAHRKQDVHENGP